MRNAVLRAWLFAVLLAAAFLHAPGALAQTCSIPGQAGAATLTAQPNTFFLGAASAGAGATSISVGTATGVNRGIQPGDLLLVIQMQGADIDFTNTNAYGDATTHAGVTNTVAFGVNGYAGGVTGANFIAGTYEWAVASGGGATFAAGGTINLSAPLANGYSTRANTGTLGRQSFQVVRVPQYSNVTVGAGFAVQPWDGSSGGLLVLEATGDINLNGQTIDGTGRGFRGGGAVNVAANGTCTGAYNTTGCQEYVSSSTASLGGSKAEGLAGTPTRLYTGDPAGTGGGTVIAGTGDGYPGGEAARGAPGNAGGGGNQHNAGGGGGGNGGAGGNGGNSWNSSVATFVGLRLGGFGGSPSGNNASRWIMGGGGGAADIGGNTTTSPDGSGGAGGALVVLRGGRILGGGATINVNGAPGQRSRATDAAGGGGAGGTVVLTASITAVVGGIAVNASGAAGGGYQGGGNEQDGAGGGGGGGVLISNVTGPVFTAGAGGAGSSNSNACPPTAGGADCGQRAGTAGGGAAGYAITTPGVRLGYECLPNLVVTKATTTPLVTAQTGGVANYVITITNSGGGARFISVYDALPPGWTLASGANPTYSPIQPLAAGRLSAGAETVATTTSSTWSVGTLPLSIPNSATDAFNLSAFALPPLRAGVPSFVTFGFTVSIPDTATAGTYHNPAGIDFLDPTRAAGSTRLVSPLTAVTANRAGTAYGPTAYINYGGVTTNNVGGANYDGTPTGPTADDVRLVADFSISKTGSATATPGTTFTYTLQPRNNGRPVGTQTYAITQATTIAAAGVAAALGSSPLKVTDTFPSGLVLGSFTGAGWTCTGTSTLVCTLPDASAYPIAAATDFPPISGTATFACANTASAFTNTATVSLAAADPVPANNTATFASTSTCTTTNLSVTKNDGTASVATASTTVYTITVVNSGPGNAGGTVLQDPAVTGLSCSTVTCAVTAGTATCPASPTVAALQGAGLVIPTLNAASTMTFSLTCQVTATGL